MTARGKTVLITGSTDGVGRRVAERLPQVDTTVLIHGRDHARAERLLAEIRSAGGTRAFYPADLSSLSEVRSLAEAVRRPSRANAQTYDATARGRLRTLSFRLAGLSEPAGNAPTGA
jgi:NAD(P)-dependent dehydrogenase (short-subunit alcohol dehydrogenase family)